MIITMKNIYFLQSNSKQLTSLCVFVYCTPVILSVVQVDLEFIVVHREFYKSFSLRTEIEHALEFTDLCTLGDAVSTSC